jgi:hypothetical protein
MQNSEDVKARALRLYEKGSDLLHWETENECRAVTEALGTLLAAHVVQVTEPGPEREEVIATIFDGVRSAAEFLSGEKSGGIVDGNDEAHKLFARFMAAIPAVGDKASVIQALAGTLVAFIGASAGNRPGDRRGLLDGFCEIAESMLDDMPAAMHGHH